MKIKLLFFAGLLLFVNSCFSQSKDELEIRSLLTAQTLEWNAGRIEDCMDGYWENDSLIFIGKSGITYGWQKTLEL